MSGLAEILRTLEFDVSGSDLKPNDNTRRLEALGRPRLLRPRRRQRERRRRRRLLERDQPAEPRGREGARARDPHHPARRDARRADAHDATRSRSRARTARRRRPRWSRPSCAQRGSTRRSSSAARSTRSERTRATARAISSSPRPTRATARSSSSRRRSPSSRTSTPSTSTTTARTTRVKDAFVAARQPRPVLRALRALHRPPERPGDPPARRAAARHVRHLAAGGLPREEPALRGARDALRRVSAATSRSATFVVHMPGAHNVLNALAVIAVADELEVPARRDARGDRELPRRPAPLHRPRAAGVREGRSPGRRDDRRRLRPSPRRDRGDARRRPARLRPARRRRVPAPPLHAHASSSSTSSRARSTRPTSSS